MEIGSNEVTNLISALALGVSIVVGVFYFKDRRHAKYAIESEYISRLLTWHAEVVEILIRLKSSASNTGCEKRSDDLCRLSALIEQGRFFFPNIKADGGFGKDKPPAYRGYRNLVLDLLVASYNLHKGDKAPAHAKQTETLQRQFTSIVFSVVNPVGRLQEIRKITDKYFAPEKSFEDFLDRNDPTAIEFIWDDR